MTTDSYNFLQNKLELVWPGKEQSVRPEPRILIEKANYNVNQKGFTDNLLIYGDNLLGLRALEHQYAGKVKCVYIDPPYNTKSCFTHYDDSMEHSMWLDMMKERLIVLHRLLRQDGTIWISIDDDECHYLKVLCDEIFGRKNFVANVIWEKKHTRSNDARFFSDTHDHIFCYAKSVNNLNLSLLPRTTESMKNYKNLDNDPRGLWTSGPCHVKTPSIKDIYPIFTPSGRKIFPPNGTSWRFSQDKFMQLVKENRIYFGPNGSNIPRYKRFLFEVRSGLIPKTLWTRIEVGDNQEAKKEVKIFNQEDVFSTPKPERLIERILLLATNPNDIVLDCFAGSGTTGAVAHKMGRRWIMIEMGEHAKTHIIPRLKKVIEGNDRGGITESTQWKGGGGFRFCEIAPSLLQRDALGRLVINKQYTPQMLKEAMCLHAGFALAENSDAWWCHGQSTQGAYVYVTPDTLTRTQLARLSYEVGSERSCLVFCGAFTCASDEFDNLTIQKIPKSILSKCDWDQEDYSLKNKPTASIGDFSHPKRQIKVQKIAAA